MMREGIGVIAFAVCAWISAVSAQDLQPEIYIGPDHAVQPPETTAPVNYLAKCLANPGDRTSCIEATRDCDAPGELCPEIATLKLPDEGPTALDQRLKSVDFKILFEYDSSAIENAEEQKLGKLAAALKDSLNSAFTFAIIGHTDSQGSDIYNCRLSQERARAVAERLTAKGVPPKQLTTIGAGERLLRNHDDGKAAENRRVSFVRPERVGKDVMDQVSKLCENTRTDERR
jgi:outer membrane protein OmpA-like peptidoglycan-associated protein